MAHSGAALKLSAREASRGPFIPHCGESGGRAGQGAMPATSHMALSLGGGLDDLSPRHSLPGARLCSRMGPCAWAGRPWVPLLPGKSVGLC